MPTSDHSEKRDLYEESIKEGQELKGWHPHKPAEYWIARHAARQTAIALLAEARRVGVTKEQLEALRAMATRVAYD